MKPHLAILAILASAAFAEVSYDYYPGEEHNVPDFAKLKAESSGTVGNFDHTLGNKAPEENYSIRFHGGLTIDKDAAYTFYLTSDDGAKLWIDDKLVVDNDGDHGPDEKTGKIKLAAGQHKIVLGYYQAGGEHALSLSYEGPDFGKKFVPDKALSAKEPETIPPAPNIPYTMNYEYYDGEFSKLPDFDKLTPTAKGECDGFDLALGGKSRAENFAIRYTGNLAIDKEGEYTFYTNSDDGSRLLLDGAVVVDNDGEHGAFEKSGKLKLTVGAHKIVLLYYQHGGDKSLQVSYSGPDLEKRTIPEGKLSK